MFRNIQWLRAVAALLVVGHHALPRYRAMGGPDLAPLKLLEFAFFGVDLFFVVSGFVMMHLVDGVPPTARNVRAFLARRAARIYGWYLPCALFALALIVAYEPASELARIDVPRSLALATIDMKTLILPVSWSLTHELYFYALMALAWVAAPRRLEPVLWTTGALLAALLWRYPFSEDSLAAFLASPFLLEFLAGALLYRHRGRLGAWPLLLACAALGTLLFWGGMQANAGSQAVRAWTFAPAAAAFVALLVGLEGSGRFVAGRVAVALGDASYSIYLLHLTAIWLVFYWGIGRTVRAAGLPVTLAVLVLLGVVFLAGCVLLHRWLEMPLYRRLCRWWQVPRATPPLAAKPAGA